MTEPTTAELAYREHIAAFNAHHCPCVDKLRAELEQAVTTAQQATGLLNLVTVLAKHLAENRHLKPVEKRTLKSIATFLAKKP